MLFISLHMYIHTVKIYIIYACAHTAKHKIFYIHTFIHSYKAILQSHLFKIHINVLHTYMHTCTHTYIHTHIHAYIHTCIHTYTHIYIHTYIQHTFFPQRRGLNPTGKATKKDVNFAVKKAVNKVCLSLLTSSILLDSDVCMYVLYVCLYTITTLSVCMYVGMYVCM